MVNVYKKPNIIGLDGESFESPINLVDFHYTEDITARLSIDSQRENLIKENREGSLVGRLGDTYIRPLEKTSGLIMETLDYSYLPSFANPSILAMPADQRERDLLTLGLRCTAYVVVAPFFFYPWKNMAKEELKVVNNKVFTSWSDILFNKSTYNSGSALSEISTLGNQRYPLANSFYKDMGCLTIIIYKDYSTGTGDEILGEEGGNDPHYIYYPPSLFYPRYKLTYREEMDRLRGSFAIDAERFDSRYNLKREPNFKEIKRFPSKIHVIKDKKSYENPASYVYAILSSYLNLRDDEGRPVYWFDPTRINFLEELAPKKELSKRILLNSLTYDIVSDINRSSNTIFKPLGYGYSVRFSDYLVRKPTAGRRGRTYFKGEV